MAFGGWSIDKALFDKISDILPVSLGQQTILELGSGAGTEELAKYYTMHSIEDNEAYLDLYDSNYIHAPLKEHKALQNHHGTIWYDARVLERELPLINYDLILIDGPVQSRTGFVKYFDLFKHDVPMVFDDSNLKRNWPILRSISRRCKRPFTVYNCWGEGKDFAVILP